MASMPASPESPEATPLATMSRRLSSELTLTLSPHSNGGSENLGSIDRTDPNMSSPNPYSSPKGPQSTNNTGVHGNNRTIRTPGSPAVPLTAGLSPSKSLAPASSFPSSPFATSPSAHRYVGLYSSLCRQPQSKQDLKTIANKKWTTALATKRVARWIRMKQAERMKLKPEPRTLARLRPPSDLREWKGRRSYLCNRCSKPCPAVDVGCTHCNVVLHRDCLTEEELVEFKAAMKEAYLRAHSPKKPKKPGQKETPDNAYKYVCDFCVEDVRIDSEWYKSERGRLWDLENKQHNAILIGRVLRGFLSRFRYKRYHRAVVQFQAMLRRYLDRRKFKQYRRSLKRPMIVNVLGCHDMPVANKDHASADPYVVVTVHDGFHKDQALRFDTSVCYKTLDCEWEPQEFLVPGVNGNAVLVFTVVDKEELRDQFLGQCDMPLSRGDLWSRGGTFEVDLGDLRYIIKDNKAQQADIAYEKITPQGQLSCQIKPLSYLTSVCGHLEGPHMDVIAGMMKNSGGPTQNVSKITQKMSYWGVVANGKFHVYRHFGDKDARVILDLATWTVAKVRLGGRPKSMHIGTGGGDHHPQLHFAEQKSERRASNADPRIAAMSHGHGDFHHINKSQPQHLREFSLKSSELSSGNRMKYVFECPNIRECRHWYEVMEHWIKEGQRGSRRSRTRSTRTKRVSRASESFASFND